ncbi:HNH endonuclease signature motif containing protein [Ornithinimicrobium flavum]|uniref:HNH endonuclease signature motif containing protein n=1 Tax=Ornithinimicrobium flavum TaxID=1288636 RepID=UPI0010701232|nr:HNH endonuclease signature motif containing protein [Ornithinimicrobium flavum]
MAFADAALVLGAASRGRAIGELPLASAAPSARSAQEAGTLPQPGAAPRSVESHRHAAEVALRAVEAITVCQGRLDAALVVATAAQATSTGAMLLREKDLAGPDELSRTARDRWRSMTKRRTRGEVAPATGWTPGESAHLIGLATAPVSFSGPVVGQMGRGQLPWRLARALWRACEGMDATDAAHVAHVMCADDQDTCVPERLEPDGRVTAAPWSHRAFWSALDREVAKLRTADDSPDAADARAAREAAFQARCVIAKAGEDGMGSLTVLMPVLWVAAIKDRLDGAAQAARAAGDERTRQQLEADIARVLLAHAALGVGDLAIPELPDGEEVTADDLARTGWSPELINAMSGLPPAVLQVVVPLLALHDPGQAQTLPTVGRPGARPTSEATLADDNNHTGQDGCPSCLPSRRMHPAEGLVDGGAGEMGRTGEMGQTGESSAVRAPSPLADPPAGPPPEQRRLWVGELLGAFSSFLSPAQIRELALSPGTTMARLLVDPADGRCVERSRATYLMDAAMRTQLLAADVTCRAPGCLHQGARCQIDHVHEHSLGGPTSEANAQLLHTGHHEPKTTKAWDAHLSANRDVTWTSLLGRVYRTRVWDYRRYVTVLTDAVDAVSAAPAEDFLDVLNQEIYLALTFRDLGDRLNTGDDDLEPDLARFGGWGLVGLTHTDPATGRRAPGPSAAAAADAMARWATAGPPRPGEQAVPGALQARSGRGVAGPDDPQPQGDEGPVSDPEGRPEYGQGEACPEPGHDHPSRVGPYDYHRISPPPRTTRSDWARRIAELHAQGRPCPPF